MGGFAPAFGQCFFFPLLHGGMGPGGLLWRADEAAPWNSLASAAATGLERVDRPESWCVGGGRTPFLGEGLELRFRTGLG